MAHPIIADFACCIYPCAPLMNGDDLALAAEILDRGHRPYVYAAHEWHDAGQFYFGAAQAFMDRVPLDHWATACIAIGKERFCDINTIEDWQRAEAMYTALKERGAL